MRTSILPMLVFGAACAADVPVPARTPDALDPCIEVEPAAVDFGGVEISDEVQPVREMVRISNTCGGALELTSLDVTTDVPNGVSVFSVDRVDQLIVQEGEQASVALTFAPIRGGTASGQLLIRSNDPERAAVSVPLSGAGLAPRIDIGPGAHDFAAPFIGCETGHPVTIRNLGTHELVIDEITLFTASEQEFSVDLDVLSNGRPPFVLAPYDGMENGPDLTFYLDYRPLDTFADEAFVTIASNDPYAPEMVLRAQGTGTFFEHGVDTFEVPSKPELDVLITLDRAEAMEDFRAATTKNLEALAEELIAADADIHAAIVVADDGCILGTEPYIDSTFGASEAIGTFRTMMDLDFTLSSASARTESGYWLTENALSLRNIGAGGCNAAFYREDAALALLNISSTADGSPNAWSYYVSLFQSLKTNPDEVVLSAIAGDYPSGCETATAGTGYYSATVATGGAFRSICASDWSKGLVDRMASYRTRPRRFELSGQPVPQNITVTIDGVQRLTGWEYHISANSIVFEAEFAPLPGSKVEITYDKLPWCDG